MTLNPSSSVPSLNTNNALHYLRIVWRLLGMHPFAKWRPLYWTYSLLINLIFSVMFPLHLIAGLFIRSDFEDIIANLTITITSASSTVKQCIIFYYTRRHLQQVPEHLRALDKRAAAQPDERTQLERMIRFCHRIFFVVCVAYHFSLYSYGLSGLMRHKLPFHGWLPFDWTRSSRVYLFSYGFQMISMSVQLLQNLSNDTYAITYLVVLAEHLRVVNGRIARLGADNVDIDYIKIKETYNQLVECVHDHWECMRYFDCISPVISGTIFVQFLITGFVLCITAIDFVNSRDDAAQVLASVFYLPCILFEVLPCCWYMDEVVEQMNELTTALFSCQWYDVDLRFQRSIIIFMQRSQKTKNIAAANLAPVTLQTFLKMVQFSFSMFAILSGVRK